MEFRNLNSEFRDENDFNFQIFFFSFRNFISFTVYWISILHSKIQTKCDGQKNIFNSALMVWHFVAWDLLYYHRIQFTHARRISCVHFQRFSSINCCFLSNMFIVEHLSCRRRLGLTTPPFVHQCYPRFHFFFFFLFLCLFLFLIGLVSFIQQIFIMSSFQCRLTVETFGI